MDQREKNTTDIPTSIPPNLNLIELLGKFLRKKVIKTIFNKEKEEFRRTIRSFFDNIEKFNKKLDSLLTFKFLLCM